MHFRSFKRVGASKILCKNHFVICFRCHFYFKNDSHGIFRLAPIDVLFDITFSLFATISKIKYYYTSISLK